MIPGEESADETVKHPRLSSDTEETDAYSENESQDEMSLDYTTKKDSNENHILQNGKDTQQTEVRNCKNDNKTVNGYFHENEPKKSFIKISNFFPPLSVDLVTKRLPILRKHSEILHHGWKYGIV